MPTSENVPSPIPSTLGRGRRAQRSSRRHRRCIGLVAGLLTVLTGVAACSGSGATKSSGGGGEAASGGAAVAAAPATADSSDVARVIVRTASMTVAVSDVDASANRIAALATQPGERVDGDQRTSDGTTHSAMLTLRVLPAHLNAVLSAISALGIEQARNVQGEDMTATKADIDARVSAMQTSVARLQTFLGQSTTVANLLLLEKQLSDRQADLDALRAKQRALNDQVDLATLAVTVNQHGTPPAAKHNSGPAGFGAALARGWHGLSVTVRYVLAGLGYALPMLAVVVLVGLGATLVRRRRRRPLAVAVAGPAEGGQREE